MKFHYTSRETVTGAYIIWLPRTRKPIARCRACDWYATEEPFKAAAAHLLQQGETP